MLFPLPSCDTFSVVLPVLSIDQLRCFATGETGVLSSSTGAAFIAGVDVSMKGCRGAAEVVWCAKECGGWIESRLSDWSGLGPSPFDAILVRKG